MKIILIVCAFTYMASYIALHIMGANQYRNKTVVLTLGFIHIISLVVGISTLILYIFTLLP